MNVCEYCQEIHPSGENRFNRLYAGMVETRFVLRTSHFVVMPTLGQLFKGSLLIVPVAHVETLASLPPDHLSELAALLEQVQCKLRDFGQPVFFEHGSTQEVAGSCGIFHAHLHVVPLPARLEPQKLLPSATDSFGSLPAALSALHHSPHYLLAGDSTRTVIAEVAALSGAPGSQYFRRRLVSLFDLDRPWDWRQTTAPEDDLLSTLEVFGVAVAAEST